MLTGLANGNIWNDLQVTEGYASNQRRNKKNSLSNISALTLFVYCTVFHQSISYI